MQSPNGRYTFTLPHWRLFDGGSNQKEIYKSSVLLPLSAYLILFNITHFFYTVLDESHSFLFSDSRSNSDILHYLPSVQVFLLSSPPPRPITASRLPYPSPSPSCVSSLSSVIRFASVSTTVTRLIRVRATSNATIPSRSERCWSVTHVRRTPCGTPKASRHPHNQATIRTRATRAAVLHFSTARGIIGDDRFEGYRVWKLRTSSERTPSRWVDAAKVSSSALGSPSGLP